ncbi:MAG: twin-arginine translocase subunit TatC [Gammaproteobacteria bacterium]
MNDSPSERLQKSETTSTQDEPQTLIAHLSELRYRLLMAAAGIAVFILVLLPFSSSVYELVSLPIRNLLPEGSSMIATEVAAPFLAPIRLSIYIAVLLAMPWILYQLWAFIAPALYRSEKIIGATLLPLSILLFYAGIAFCWYLILPLLFSLFITAAPEGVTVMTDINSYLNFVLRFALTFGLAFQTPIVVIALITLGVVSAKRLAHMRPYIVIGCLVSGMLLTPPDVVSQLVLAIPIWTLFELGLLLGRLLTYYRTRNQATKT